MSDKTIVAKVTNAMGHALGKLAWMTVETVFYLAILAAAGIGILYVMSANDPRPQRQVHHCPLVMVQLPDHEDRQNEGGV